MDIDLSFFWVTVLFFHLFLLKSCSFLPIQLFFQAFLSHSHDRRPVALRQEFNQVVSMLLTRDAEKRPQAEELLRRGGTAGQVGVADGGMVGTWLEGPNFLGMAVAGRSRRFSTGKNKNHGL